jgi:hypothetical protein
MLPPNRIHVDLLDSAQLVPWHVFGRVVQLRGSNRDWRASGILNEGTQENVYKNRDMHIYIYIYIYIHVLKHECI